VQTLSSSVFHSTSYPCISGSSHSRHHSEQINDLNSADMVPSSPRNRERENECGAAGSLSEWHSHRRAQRVEWKQHQEEDDMIEWETKRCEMGLEAELISVKVRTWQIVVLEKEGMKVRRANRRSNYLWHLKNRLRENERGLCMTDFDWHL